MLMICIADQSTSKLTPLHCSNHVGGKGDSWTQETEWHMTFKLISHWQESWLTPDPHMGTMRWSNLGNREHHNLALESSNLNSSVYVSCRSYSDSCHVFPKLINLENDHTSKLHELISSAGQTSILLLKLTYGVYGQNHSYWSIIYIYMTVLPAAYYFILTLLHIALVPRSAFPTTLRRVRGQHNQAQWSCRTNQINCRTRSLISSLVQPWSSS